MDKAHQNANEKFHSQRESGPLTAMFREIVLSLGGVFATHSVDDKVVSSVARSLGRVVDRHICPAAGTSSSTNKTDTARPIRPHPAIEELLSRIGVARPALASDRDHEWLRLPGLFRRWEFEQVIDVDEEYLVEDAGKAPDGTPLFAIYSRLPIDLRSRCVRLQMSTVSEVSRETRGAAWHGARGHREAPDPVRARWPRRLPQKKFRQKSKSAGT